MCIRLVANPARITHQFRRVRVELYLAAESDFPVLLDGKAKSDSHVVFDGQYFSVHDPLNCERAGTQYRHNLTVTFEMKIFRRQLGSGSGRPIRFRNRLEWVQRIRQREELLALVEVACYYTHSG